MMQFDDGNKCEVSSRDIIKTENLSQGQPRRNAQIQSHSGAKRQQRNLSDIILRPTEAVREQTENSKATPELGHCTRNAEGKISLANLNGCFHSCRIRKTY